MALLNILENDCRQWAGQELKELLLNENVMQTRLVMYLEDTQHYDRVYTEYFVPLEMLRKQKFAVPTKSGPKTWNTSPNFPWPEDMFIDIVVEKDGKFAAVELKYATSPLDDACKTAFDNEIKVFNQPVPSKVVDVAQTGATNQIMYNYWKDVRRIEALTRFKDVVGGLAMIISNEQIYWNAPKGTPGYIRFSMHQGHQVGPYLAWTGCGKMKKYNPAFKLDHQYMCDWYGTSIDATAKKGHAPFRYMINVIKWERQCGLCV